MLEELAREANADVPAEDRDDVTLVLLEVRAGPSGFDNGTADAEAAAAAPGRANGADVVWYGEDERASYLALRGRATWTHSAAFHDTARAIRGAGRPLAVDLSDCEYLDSTFLGTIHELVADGGVEIQNVRPEVEGLFRELGMDRVLASVREEPQEVPELYALAAPPADVEAGRRRILDAHEALSALSARNRESFAAVLKGLRHGDGSG